MPVGKCAAILFGEHFHQIFPDSAYNEDGILYELARLLDAVSSLEAGGVDLNYVFDHSRDPYYHFAILRYYFPHLSGQFKVVYEFAVVYQAFIESDYYESDGNYAAYCYFKAGITSQSSLRDKILNVRYAGMRTCDIISRLSLVRNDITNAAEFLVACDGLMFEGVELDTNISKQTSHELEQLAISCFLNAPSGHVLNRLKNKIFITGTAHKIFDNTTYEKMLAAYVLVSGLAVDKQVTAMRTKGSKTLTAGSNWFHVDLTPKLTSGVNGTVDQLKLESIHYYAGLVRAGDNWKTQTLEGQLSEKNSKIEDLNIQLDECKAENEELRSLLPDYMN
ncbi:hypothetical protein M3Y97_00366400 [Aphelenchoides bicaudatus]|nr:hypothetical protein M3Y97_00366400 [Aphelenchoides bicaudatus]